MSYFKDSNNKVYWLDRIEDQAEFLTEDCVEITDEEAADLLLTLHQKPIPESVTMRQARLALLQAGHLGSVQSAINAIEDPVLRQASQIEWEYAATVDRSSSFTQGMATALGLSEQDMDNLFMLAVSL
jgi:hypothetical protein